MAEGKRIYKLSDRQRFELMRSQLDGERATFTAHWRDLGDFINPRRGRFTVTDTNKGDRRTQKIIDSTATFSSNILRSGMMSGVTSPARPWFKLATPDPDLSEYSSVKEWLHLVSTRMSTVFLKSNLYNVLPMMYGDGGTFATAPILIEEDFDQVIRAYSFPVGSYMISNNYRLQVDTFFREFRMTIRQLIEKFGDVDDDGNPDWSKFSETIKSQYENGQYEAWIDVCHTILPNPYYDPRKAAVSEYKKYLSVYYERGYMGNNPYQMSPSEENRYLSRKGYDYFPVLCHRWETTGEDAYGTNCPGMTALGDIKQLQTGEKRSAQAIEKMVNPPMVGPTALKRAKASILPGDITYTDEREGQKGFRPAHEINFRVDLLDVKQQEIRRRIQRAFYEDLFLMIASAPDTQRTATEIAERKEEKLLALGPVLEQLNQDVLDPLIDITFNMMERQGLIPPPPEELRGMSIKVEYQSIMAQAQKLVGLAGQERFTQYVGQVASFDPNVLHKINSDELIDSYADIVSLGPKIVRTDDEVAEIRRGIAEQTAKAQQPEQLAQTAKAAKDLSQAELGGDNALSALVNQAQSGL